MKQQRKDKAARQAKEKEWFDLETIGSAIWGPGCQPDWPTLMERNSQTFGGWSGYVFFCTSSTKPWFLDVFVDVQY
jgi:hypothetical protein